MKDYCMIVVAETNDKHFEAIRSGFLQAGVNNEIIRLNGKDELEEFFFDKETGLSAAVNSEHVLFLDISMPGIGQTDFLARLKKNYPLKKMPVIILTQIDDPQTVDRCHSIGCSIYLVKPARDTDIADRVKKVALFLNSVELPNLA